jgi:hypothetical protein
MKHKLTFLTSAIILGSLIFITSCSSTRAPKTIEIDVPIWFTNVPTDANYLFASATARSQDLQHAVNTAKEEARIGIARQMRVKVDGMFKRFREETGVGEDAEFLSMETDVSKSVVSETLVGCKTRTQKILREGTLYRIYVLMELPIGAASKEMLAKIKENERMYTRYRASQAFKELEEEVEKYQKIKK